MTRAIRAINLSIVSASIILGKTLRQDLSGRQIRFYFDAFNDLVPNMNHHRKSSEMIDSQETYFESIHSGFKTVSLKSFRTSISLTD